ncbi:MAG: aminotransferase class III-fold pyridoxal phosphate-dependent enzyme [bacterium]|nr:aminotransferase class III-fold pyridoxal phosphate-dependent enzyme [bacterium]
MEFSISEVKELTKRLYDLNVSVKPLVSFADYNFLLTGETGERFVLKIANASESLEILTAQNDVLEHLGICNPSLNCPRVHRTPYGDGISPVKSSNGMTHHVRMLTYLPGTFLGHMDRKTHSPELMTDFGRFLGSLDKTLEEFDDPALHGYREWDLKNSADIENYLDSVSDPGPRNLAHYFINQFKLRALPKLLKLRTSVIHNDANDYNVLTGDDKNRVAGIIDFGDMVHTYTVCEPAIAIAYAIHGKDNVLETAAHILRGYHQVYPLTEAELEVLFYLVSARLCATSVYCAHELTLTPENKYLGISMGPAREALEKMIAIDPDHAHRVFRQACGFPDTAKSRGLSPVKNLELRKKYLGKSLSVSYREPLKIVRGFMQYLYDDTGRAYLDTVNNVCHVGHCHPRVVKAGQEQMETLNTNTRYLHDNIVNYAQQLTATLPDPLSVCFFFNSGSEANELALRLARTHTGKTGFVVMDHAYHGNTGGIVDISPYKFDGPGGRGAPGHVHKTVMPDLYRGPYKYGDPDSGQKYAADVERVFKTLKPGDSQAAAFIHESVPGVAGQIVLPEGYLEAAYRHARASGAVCIADEVQIGFGRVGSHMWGFETQGVIPDIVTMGKPMGNGHPLAAVVTTPGIADAFNNGMEYFNSFGGTPVSCAIGLAVLEVIRSEGLQEHALTVGEYMKTGLRDLMAKYPLIGDVRGLGLFIGIELVTDGETLSPARKEAEFIAGRMKEEGILVSIDGPLHNVIKIKPPLVFNRADAGHYIKTLDRVLSEGFEWAKK